MGLDQYAGFRDLEGNVQEKFYWRKHARLQNFMSKKFNEQNKNLKHKVDEHLQHLGFNSGQGGVNLTKEIVAELKEAISKGYYDNFASDGFFWGQQFQEAQVEEYKKQDKEFVSWAEEQLKSNEKIGYDCSW